MQLDDQEALLLSSDFLLERGERVPARGTWGCVPQEGLVFTRATILALSEREQQTKEADAPESVQTAPLLLHHGLQPKSQPRHGPWWPD